MWIAWIGGGTGGAGPCVVAFYYARVYECGVLADAAVSGGISELCLDIILVM